MVSIFSLWIPILLSAVIVFVASSLVHMLFRYHANDFHKLPDEGMVADALRKSNVAAGQYMLPYAETPREARSAEFRQKLEKGPGAMLTVWPAGRPSMVSNLVQWFVYSIVIGIFAAYVATRALGPEAHYLEVFRFVGFTAFVCYTVAGWQDSIWFRRSWGTTIRNTLDGLIYALLTAGTFGWLWPR